ncbi:MAG: tetratricopeptide repeat protein [Chloroflexi bacterium]|nr:tetratricopeptide repeat protein [Chloroflexota bacterium]
MHATHRLGNSASTDASESFGEVLRRYRLEAGLTQEQLAEGAEMSVRGLQKLERGQTRPYRETLERLIQALRLEEDEAAYLRLLGRPQPRRTDEPDAEIMPDTSVHNLPRLLTDLIGRTQELADLERLLSSVRLITITGPAGIGKTHFTIYAAWQHLARYRDGVWWIDLAAITTPTSVAQAIASALQITEQPPYPVEETLYRSLRDDQALLCLDGCDRVIIPTAHIVDHLLRSCPGICILATSREPLRVSGEQLLRLQPLGYPTNPRSVTVEEALTWPAIHLFIDRARASDPTFALTSENLSYLLEICEQLDGLPLALELAAGCVSALSVAQIAERLHERFILLTGGSRSAPQRHQTLRAAIDWSYDLLDAEQQRLFDRLSIFASGWDLEAAEAICAGPDLEAAQVVQLMVQLVSRSVVMADTRHPLARRYYLLETLRLYGQQRLRERGELSAMRERHVRYFLDLARQAAAESSSPQSRSLWLGRIERDEANFCVAFQWLHEHRRVRDLAELANALTVYWHMQNHYSDAQARLNQVLAYSELASFEREHERTLYNAGTIMLAIGEYRRAWELLIRAVAIARSLNDPIELAQVLGSAAEVAIHNRERFAQPLLEESLAIYQRSGDRTGEAKRLGQLGVLLLYAGKIEEGTSFLQRSVALSQEVDDAVGVAHAIAGLGLAACILEDWELAERHFRDARTRYRAVANRRGEGRTLCSLAQVALRRQQLTSASRLLLESLELAREINLRDLEAWALLNLGRLYRERHNFTAAVAHLAECLTIRLTLGYEWGVATTLAEIGEVYERQREWHRAVIFYAAAERRFTAPELLASPGDPSGYSLDRLIEKLNTLRHRLGEEKWHRAWELGHGLEDRDLNVPGEQLVQV